jgi:hypothetical protein
MIVVIPKLLKSNLEYLDRIAITHPIALLMQQGFS